MRSIIYVAPDVPIPFPSGASVHVSELARNLKDSGHQIHVIARRMKRSDRPIELWKGVTIHRVYRLILFEQPESSKPGGARDSSRTSFFGRLYYAYLVTVFALYVSLLVSRIVKRERIDSIIERETSFGAGALASIFTGRPLILEIIGPRFSELSARRSRNILYYTETMLNGKVARAKCIAVSAGVNLDLFKSDKELGQMMRSRLGIGDSKVVGYVGTFQDWHGVDVLLIAMKRLLENGKSVKAVLVGPNFEHYIDNARNYGVLGDCKFVGPARYEEIPAYINACDVMVAPYNPNANPLRKAYGIGSPLKLFETMACEKPLISTNVRPIRDIPSIGDVAILVSPGDPIGLAEAITKLLENDSDGNQMGKRGRMLTEAEYSWEPLAHRISSLIQAA